jgi:hypothetical protein
MDRGERTSYRALERGTRVECADGQELGTVKRVMAVTEKDVFDGIVVRTPEGDRFVDAPEVGEIYESVVLLKIDSEAAAALPKPGANPASMGLKPDDFTGPSRLRRAWQRLTGR